MPLGLSVSILLEDPGEADGAVCFKWAWERTLDVCFSVGFARQRDEKVTQYSQYWKREQQGYWSIGKAADEESSDLDSQNWKE